MSPSDPGNPYGTVGAIPKIHTMVSGFLVEAVQDIPESRMAKQPFSIVNHPS